MIIFRCTQKLLTELHFNKQNLKDPGEGFLGSWFANLFRIERRKCVLFTNDRTLYSVLLYGLKKPDFDALGQRFTSGLLANLKNDGFPPEQVASIGMTCQKVSWGVTNNRRVLGSMNDMILTTKYMVAVYRQPIEQEIAQLNHELNRTPMSMLKRIVAIDEMRAALEHWRP